MEMVISLFSLLFAMLAFFLQYHSTSKEHQERLAGLLRGLLGSTSRIVSYAIVLVIFLLSLLGIYFFWTGSEPVQRREIVLLVLHFINVFMYGYLALAIPAKAIIKRYAPVKESASVETESV